MTRSQCPMNDQDPMTKGTGYRVHVAGWVRGVTEETKVRVQCATWVAFPTCPVGEACIRLPESMAGVWNAGGGGGKNTSLHLYGVVNDGEVGGDED